MLFEAHVQLQPLTQQVQVHTWTGPAVTWAGPVSCAGLGLLPKAIPHVSTEHKVTLCNCPSLDYPPEVSSLTHHPHVAQV